MNIDEIIAAYDRINPHIRHTPLLSSSFLDAIAGKRVFVKAEGLQHTGSFKYRGATAAISKLDPAIRQRGIIAFSSGNHAQAIAMAAGQFNAPSVIIMPADAPRIKIENTRALGAEVVLYDRATQDRAEIGAALSQARNLTMIQPFDHPDVIAGQGTVGLELAKQAQDIGIQNASVLVPCGGGGLTSGVALALHENATNFHVHPVEPEGFDDVARSLISGKIEQNEKRVGSICDAIITPSPGALTFPIMKRLCKTGQVVSDEDCLHALALAFIRLKIVIEPGAATSLAAALFQAQNLEHDTIIAIATGANVDAPIFNDALTKYA
jgi:threonine dehydratase